MQSYKAERISVSRIFTIFSLKALLRDQETQNAIEEAEIRNLELQLQKKMFEQVHTSSGLV